MLVGVGKSPNSDSNAFSESFGPGFWFRLFPFGPGKYKYPKYGDVSNKHNLPRVETRTYPVVREEK